MDRLVTEFGPGAARVGFAQDYGRTQNVAICSDWDTLGGVYIFALFNPEYDLNNDRAHLDEIIEKLRPGFRGFGL